MDGALLEQPRDDSSGGADGKVCVMVALEDEGDFLSFRRLGFRAGMLGQLALGLVPFWLVRLLSHPAGKYLAVLYFLEAFLWR